MAKENQTGVTVYRDFHAVDQGSPVFVRRYATDRLAERAIDFVRTAPATRPFFLLFAPSAPHPPWIPAARHEGAFAELRIEEPPTVAGALRGAPPWVRSLPFPSAAQRAAWLDDQRHTDETLLAVDEALRGIVTTLGDRLDDTVIFVLSDNGYSFGEHRWEGKTCPYDACVRIPLAVYTPGCGSTAGTEFVSIVDLAPTILDLAGAPPIAARDGQSFAATLAEDVSGDLRRKPDPVFLEWVGDERIPAWRSVRTADFTLIRYADGFEELYDIGGRFGPADPWESTNLARRSTRRGCRCSGSGRSSVASWGPARLTRCDRGRSSDLSAGPASVKRRQTFGALVVVLTAIWRGSSGHPPARSAGQNPDAGGNGTAARPHRPDSRTVTGRSSM